MHNRAYEFGQYNSLDHKENYWKIIIWKMKITNSIKLCVKIFILMLAIQLPCIFCIFQGFVCVLFFLGKVVAFF